MTFHYEDGDTTVVCECGNKFHVSLFRHRILVAIRRAIELTRLDQRLCRLLFGEVAGRLPTDDPEEVDVFPGEHVLIC